MEIDIRLKIDLLNIKRKARRILSKTIDECKEDINLTKEQKVDFFTKAFNKIVRDKSYEVVNEYINSQKQSTDDDIDYDNIREKYLTEIDKILDVELTRAIKKINKQYK